MSDERAPVWNIEANELYLQDAKRYRLLRKWWWNFGSSNYAHDGMIGGKKFWDGLDAIHDAESPRELDAAIDAAIDVERWAK